LRVKTALQAAVWVAEKEFRQFFGGLPAARLIVTLLVPLLLLMVFSFRVGGVAPQHVPIAVVDLDRSSYSSDLMTVLTTDDRFVITRALSRAEAENMIRRGESSAAILVPQDFSKNIERHQQASLELVLDDSNPFFAKSVYDLIDDSVRTAANNLSPQPITAKLSFMYGVGFGFVDFIVPGIVAMTAMFGTTFQALSFVWERTLGTLDRIRSTPVGAGSIILGKIIAGSLIGIAQAIVVLTFSHFVFGAVVRNVGVLILIVFLVAFIFTGIGVTVSALVDEPRAAMMVNQMINWPMVLLSGVFYPVEALPDALRPIASLLPLTYAIEALRAVVIKGLSFGASEVLIDVGVLLLYAAATLALGSRLLFRILSR
jgi:ABC-2 type transport system permease protein